MSCTAVLHIVFTWRYTLHLVHTTISFTFQLNSSSWEVALVSGLLDRQWSQGGGVFPIPTRLYLPILHQVSGLVRPRTIVVPSFSLSRITAVVRTRYEYILLVSFRIDSACPLLSSIYTVFFANSLVHTFSAGTRLRKGAIVHKCIRVDTIVVFNTDENRV